MQCTPPPFPSDHLSQDATPSGQIDTVLTSLPDQSGQTDFPLTPLSDQAGQNSTPSPLLSPRIDDSHLTEGPVIATRCDAMPRVGENVAELSDTAATEPSPSSISHTAVLTDACSFAETDVGFDLTAADMSPPSKPHEAGYRRPDPQLVSSCVRRLKELTHWYARNDPEIAMRTRWKPATEIAALPHDNGG